MTQPLITPSSPALIPLAPAIVPVADNITYNRYKSFFSLLFGASFLLPIGLFLLLLQGSFVFTLLNVFVGTLAYLGSSYLMGMAWSTFSIWLKPIGNNVDTNSDHINHIGSTAMYISARGLTLGYFSMRLTLAWYALTAIGVTLTLPSIVLPVLIIATTTAIGYPCAKLLYGMGVIWNNALRRDLQQHDELENISLLPQPAQVPSQLPIADVSNDQRVAPALQALQTTSPVLICPAASSIAPTETMDQARPATNEANFNDSSQVFAATTAALLSVLKTPPQRAAAHSYASTTASNLSVVPNAGVLPSSQLTMDNLPTAHLTAGALRPGR